jgi:hypothetical protein
MTVSSIVPRLVVEGQPLRYSYRQVAEKIESGAKRSAPPGKRSSYKLGYGTTLDWDSLISLSYPRFRGVSSLSWSAGLLRPLRD